MKTKKKAAKKAAKKTEKLTPTEEKRVAVLKDALSQLRAEAYIAESGNGYVKNYNLDTNIESLCEIADIVSPKGEKTELQVYIDRLVNKQKPCDVCAKGALFLSSIRKYNNVSLLDLKTETLDNMASDKMRVFFGENNADLIETYFESGSPDPTDNDGDDIDDPWMRLTDTERLIRIFKNAIKHKGIFKPKLEKF